MTSYNTPSSIYFNGIDFNPSIIEQGNTVTSGLTQAQASALYLQKTVADTATATESFSNGIKSSVVDVYPASTSTMTFAASANAVNIGQNSSTTTTNGNTNLAATFTSGNAYYGQTQILNTTNTNTTNYFAANNTANNAAVRVLAHNGSGYTGLEGGLYQIWSGISEWIFNASQTIRNLPSYYGMSICYNDGTGFPSGQSATTITSYGPYGGTKFCGVGANNTKGYSSTVGESMCTYPGYGTRFINSGVSFNGKSNLTSGINDDRGWVPICGVYPLHSQTVANGASAVITISFGYTYSANPYVTVTPILQAGASSGTDAFVMTVFNVSTTGFSVNCRNGSGGTTGTNQWGFHWMSWAPY